MSFVLSNYVEILAAVGAVISAATLITAITPSPKDDVVVGKIRKVFEFFALSIAKK